MALTSGARRPARRRGFAHTRAITAALAVIWVGVGLVSAARYVDAYYQHRGFAIGKRPPGVPAGRLLTEHFFSPALGRTADYEVYVPTGFSPARRYPVFYLLHGSPGRPENFVRIADMDVRLDTLISRGRVRPMLLAFPDGRIGGSLLSNSEWANAGRGKFESYVLDVVRDLDSRFPVLPARAARVLGGYSEGGYGAINVGLHHVDTFAGIQSWSGYYVQNRFASFSHADNAQLAANSPLDYAATLGPRIQRLGLRAFLYSGVRDPESRQLPAMVGLLRAAGAQATYRVYPGSHDWALWHAHVDEMLTVASRDLRRPPRPVPRLSGAAARRAARRGHLAALAALAFQRQQARQHTALLRVCRADTSAALRTAASLTAGISARGTRIIDSHLAYNCRVAYGSGHTPLAAVPPLLCRRLPYVIAIVHHAVRRRAGAVTQRCLRDSGAPERLPNIRRSRARRAAGTVPSVLSRSHRRPGA